MSSAGSFSILNDLRQSVPPLRLKKGRPVLFDDEATHRVAWEANAELYALSAVATGVPKDQRSRVLYTLLASSWARLSDDARALALRIVHLLLAATPAEEVLTVFLSLRHARANHKHTSRAIVRYLTENPAAFALANARRPAVRDALEHAVGRKVARAAYTLAEDGRLPYAVDHARANQVLAIVYGATWSGDAAIAPSHAPFVALLDAGDVANDAPKTVTATNRGDVSATLVHMYRGGATDSLRRALNGYVEKAAARLERYDGKIALILDASASMRGYGERAYCSIAQSVALSLVLERACPNLLHFRVGGSGANPPVPSGATDLASAVIDAAACAPDVIAIVTDGYENSAAGDLVDVVRALPRAIPVVVCQSKFTFKDDLALRRVPSLDEIGMWHENDFAEVLLAFVTRGRRQSSSSSNAQKYVRRVLETRLSMLEKEAPSWLSPH